jgi:pimeloyl-ACP methyl ester carboxylesterase
MNHKPFKVIADYLTRNNIAVFRYDDRGWNGDITDSTINNATTLDYAVDAQAAFDMIKTHPNINPKHIGMLGHSEGGVITSIAASKNPNISFVILLASTGQKGIDVLLQQNEVILKNIKMPKHAVKMQLSALKQMYKYIVKDYTSDEIEKRMNLWFEKELSKLNAEQRKESPFSTAMERTKFINQLSSNWMRTFLKLNPSDYLTKVKQPTFALNGTNDVQVLQEYNLPQIEKALKKAKNKNYKTYKAIAHNHLFQQCTTGMIDEYSKIEQTISPIILEQIKEFIKSTTK